MVGNCLDENQLETIVDKTFLSADTAEEDTITWQEFYEMYKDTNLADQLTVTLKRNKHFDEDSK